MFVSILNEIKGISCEGNQEKIKLLSLTSKLRMETLRHIIENLLIVDEYFNGMLKAIRENNYIDMNYILETLFIQEVPIGFIDMIINTYNNTDKKDELIEELRKSYQAKGIDGMLHAWYPILKGWK